MTRRTEAMNIACRRRSLVRPPTSLDDFELAGTTASRYSMIELNTIHAIGKIPNAAPYSVENHRIENAYGNRGSPRAVPMPARSRCHPCRLPQNAEHDEQHEDGDGRGQRRQARLPLWVIVVLPHISLSRRSWRARNARTCITRWGLTPVLVRGQTHFEGIVLAGFSLVRALSNFATAARS